MSALIIDKLCIRFLTHSFGHLRTKLRMLISILLCHRETACANIQINKLICKSEMFLCTEHSISYSWDTFRICECRPQETLGDVCKLWLMDETCENLRKNWTKARAPSRIKSLAKLNAFFFRTVQWLGAFILIHQRVWNAIEKCNGIIRRTSINYSSDKNCPTFELINLHFILPFQLKRARTIRTRPAQKIVSLPQSNRFILLLLLRKL